MSVTQFLNPFQQNHNDYVFYEYIKSKFGSVKNLTPFFYQGAGGSPLTIFNAKICYIGSLDANFNAAFTIAVYNELNAQSFAVTGLASERQWHIDDLLFFRIVGAPIPVYFQFVGYKFELP